MCQVLPARSVDDTIEASRHSTAFWVPAWPGPRYCSLRFGGSRECVRFCLLGVSMTLSRQVATLQRSGCPLGARYIISLSLIAKLRVEPRRLLTEGGLWSLASLYLPRPSLFSSLSLRAGCGLRMCKVLPARSVYDTIEASRYPTAFRAPAWCSVHDIPPCP